MGIETKEDELATLYDILFDEEILCGMRLYTETRRCYRLTKQAFVNVSYGLTLQSGLTSQSAAPKAYNWKKNDNSTNNNDWRNSRVDNYHSQRSFNQNQQNQSNNNGNQNTVSQFFSAYRHPNAAILSKLCQTAKQELDPAKSTVLAPAKSTVPAPVKTGDAEFQAMWSQLQQKQHMAPADPPVACQVSEQTNALKKFLKIKEFLDHGGDQNEYRAANSPDVSKCTHNGACCAELANMCKRLGLTYEYCQRYDQHTGNMSGVVSFPDGNEFIGPPCKDRPKASETAACLALREYPAIVAKRTAKTKIGMKSGGPPGMPLPAARGLPFPFANRTRSGQPMVIPAGQFVQMPQVHRVPPPMIPAQTLLPNPPQQWCQQPTGSTKPNLNPFVPLQAQTAAIAKNADNRKPQQPKNRQPPPTTLTGQRMNTDIVRPIPQSPKKKTPENPPSTSAQPPPSRKQRKGRIAAKFSTPLQN